MFSSAGRTGAESASHSLTVPAGLTFPVVTGAHGHHIGVTMAPRASGSRVPGKPAQGTCAVTCAADTPRAACTEARLSMCLFLPVSLADLWPQRLLWNERGVCSRAAVVWDLAASTADVGTHFYERLWPKPFWMYYQDDYF